MALRRVSGPNATTASIFVAGLLVAGGCVTDGDSQATFDPLGDHAAGASAGSGSGGKPLGGAGTSNGTGAQPSAGSSSGGSGSVAGSSPGGIDAGGTDAGGTDTGGTDAGGTDTGGTNTGGTGTGGTDPGGSAGTSSGGSAGSNAGGMGGMAGAPSCIPTDEKCDGLDNDCDKVIDPAATCPAGCTGATYGGHDYYFCGVVEDAEAAYTKCAGYGMAMVAIESNEENAFVLGQLKGSSWIGATDDEDENRWIWLSTGATFWNHGPVQGQYANWAQFQPNNDGPDGADENCLVIQAPAIGLSRGLWNDLVCDAEGYRATCESTGP